MERRRSQGTPVERRIGPVRLRASASSAEMAPTPTVRCRNTGCAGQELVVLLGPRDHRVADDADVVLPSVGEIRGGPARPDEVVVHPKTGRLLEEPEDHLALAEAVDHHRGRAEVHPVGRHPHEVRRDPVELDHQHPDPLGPWRQLDPEQRLDRHREHQLVGERCEVVHPGDVGGPLDVGELFAGLLHPVCR